MHPHLVSKGDLYADQNLLHSVIYSNHADNNINIFIMHLDWAGICLEVGWGAVMWCVEEGLYKQPLGELR